MKKKQFLACIASAVIALIVAGCSKSELVTIGPGGITTSRNKTNSESEREFENVEIELKIIGDESSTSAAKATVNNAGVRLVATPSDDHLFYGWSFSDKDPASNCFSKEEVFILSRKELESKTIYAFFEKKRTLTINPNGGTSSVGETLEYGCDYEPFVLPKDIVTKEGSVFTGWIDQFQQYTESISLSKDFYYIKSVKACWSEPVESLENTVWQVIPMGDSPAVYLPLVFKFTTGHRVGVFTYSEGEYFNIGMAFQRMIHMYEMYGSKSTLALDDLGSLPEVHYAFNYTDPDEDGNINITFNNLILGSKVAQSFNWEYVYRLNYKDGALYHVAPNEDKENGLMSGFKKANGEIILSSEMYLSYGRRYSNNEVITRYLDDVSYVPCSLLSTNADEYPIEIYTNDNAPLDCNPQLYICEEGILDKWGYFYPGEYDEEEKMFTIQAFGYDSLWILTEHQMNQFMHGTFGYAGNYVRQYIKSRTTQAMTISVEIGDLSQLVEETGFEGMEDFDNVMTAYPVTGVRWKTC